MTEAERIEADKLKEMGFINGHPDRNYEEDFEHENGNYISKCRECGLYFRGHKRRFICKQCIEPNWLELSKKQPPKEIKNNAWPGCWADGEMTGFARCMIQKVQPLKAENERLQQLIKEKDAWIAEERTINKELGNECRIANDELKSAQEMSRELVELVRKKFDGFTVHWSDFESLINKAK